MKRDGRDDWSWFYFTNRLSAIDVGHTPRDISRCVGHNRVISRSIEHRLSAIDVGHTPRDVSRCVGHYQVISQSVEHCLSAIDVGHTPRDVSQCVVTTGLSRGPSHTARYRGVSVTHRVISRYVSHTAACSPSMSVTHRVIYRGVSVTTGLSRNVRHTPRCVRRTPRDIAVCPSHTA